jgi:crotonobetainyl-CoA:carnitine CoA-transferase CaiB-like acyl-CoA transferase
LSPANVCVGKLNDMSEIFEDPQLKARGMVTTVDHPELGPVRQLGVAIKLSETPGAARGFAPWKGQHSDEVLGSSALETRRSRGCAPPM